MSKVARRALDSATGLFLLLLLLSLAVLVSCDPFHAEFADVEDAERYKATEQVTPRESPAALKVMSWNVKFGGGRVDFFFDCHGEVVLMEKDAVIAHMEGIAAKIRAYDPDVLMVQEIDTRSKRSAYVDQVRYLLENTDLNYAVYASQWRADYVPSDGIGAVDSGNAILSKWPLRDARRLSLPLVEEQSALVQYFYLKRNLLEARLELPDSPDDEIWILATHTDAYGQDGTKQKQIDRLHEEMTKRAEAGALVIAGGDLNTIPPGSETLHDFPDSVCTDEDFQADDYRDEEGWLDALYEDFVPAISLEDYTADNSPYFTHTTEGSGFWNRKLDYLFTNGAWLPGSGLVHQDAEIGGMPTMPLSDHAPLTAVVELGR